MPTVQGNLLDGALIDHGTDRGGCVFDNWRVTSYRNIFGDGADFELKILLNCTGYFNNEVLYDLSLESLRLNVNGVISDWQ